MRLFSFQASKQPRLGAEWAGQLVDLKEAYSVLLDRGLDPPPIPALPGEMMAFLQAGEAAWRAARLVLDFIARRPAVPVGAQLIYPLNGVEVIAPLPRPGKILCSTSAARGAPKGKGDRLRRQNVFFTKVPSAVIGPSAPIVIPRGVRQVECELQLGAVIGKRMKEVPEDRVPEGMAGYTVLNNVSARETKGSDQERALARNCDTFCPLGPALVSRDGFVESNELTWEFFLNDRSMQQYFTQDWIFSLRKIVYDLTQVMTLEPGDIVSTPAPAEGGTLHSYPVAVKAGDVVRLEISGVGQLENPVRSR